MHQLTLGSFFQMGDIEADRLAGSGRQAGPSESKLNIICIENRPPLHYQRKWECAERKTRGSSGIDGVIFALFVTLSEADLFRRLAVAILALIRSEKNSFPPSTVIIEQYRAPIGKFIIG